MTGLTIDLKDRNYNVREWLEECMARQYGMCAVLKDYPSLTKKQIIKELKKEREYVPDKPKFLTKEEAYEKHKKSIENIKRMYEEESAYVNKLRDEPLPELYKIQNYENIKFLYPLNNIIVDTIKHIKEDLSYSERMIQYTIEDMNKEFHYDEEEAKKQYEKDLVYYNECLNKSKVDKSEPYKNYLSQLEEVYNNIEV